MRFIISGGGTGGHIFPAIAIADAIKRQVPNADILFVGAEGKMEMERVPKAGYKIVGLWISGFQRSLSFQNLLIGFKLISSMWKARKIIKEFKPDVVIGVGGYASGPTLKAAERMGIPTVLQEQNSYAGATNKLLAKGAARICVAYEGMDHFFPKDKIQLTGNPVRADIQQLRKSDEAVKHFGLDPNKQTVTILGGSLGARTINQAMDANFSLISARPNVQYLWQCGKLYYEQYKDCSTARLPNVKIFPFIDRMDLAYAITDVAIARAGALTVSELCLAGRASILVPSPNVAEDHQTKNAMALVGKDAALLVKDSEAKDKMIAQAMDVLHNNELSQSLTQNISAMAKPNAADDIAKVIIGLVK